VEILLRMINREPIEQPLQLLRPELVVRESTEALVAPVSPVTDGNGDCPQWLLDLEPVYEWR